MNKLSYHNANDPRLIEAGWSRKFFLFPQVVWVLTPMRTFKYMAWLETLEFKESGGKVDWRFKRERNF